ncbi:MAG: hypothetical protein NT062_07015, partial [Proteobacteria bacterium]|nr:hypothetical protein [Pseudomonadota bacterium]
VAFAFTVSDGAIACSLDAAAFTTCASPQAWNVPAGAHQLRVQATDQVGNVTTALRAWTTACSAPTASGAVGLLHFDTGDQVQPNAVLAAASATLGTDATVEPADPAFVAAARFAGGLALTSGDLVAWPLGAGATSTPSFTLYATPDRPAALVTVLATADGRLALRVVPGSGTTVKFALAVDGNVATSSQVAAGQSHHVAASLTGTTLRLWVDGDRTDVVSTLAMPLALDALQLGGTYGGVLDEVWIATTGLSSDDAALATYCPM